MSFNVDFRHLKYCLFASTRQIQLYVSNWIEHKKIKKRLLTDEKRLKKNTITETKIHFFIPYVAFDLDLFVTIGRVHTSILFVLLSLFWLFLLLLFLSILFAHQTFHFQHELFLTAITFKLLCAFNTHTKIKEIALDLNRNSNNNLVIMPSAPSNLIKIKFINWKNEHSK